MKIKKLWVIKAGSAMVVHGGPLLVRAWAGQIAHLRKLGIGVVWVSSGAIATGALRAHRQWKTLPEKQALSAIGQPAVVDMYNLALQPEGLQAAQVLITYDDMKHSKRKKNLQNTLQTLLSWGVIPIINENDTVATEEIQFGDNDGLSAKLAVLLKADRLVILTDVEGLYTADPKNNPQAELIHQVNRIDQKILAGLEKKVKKASGTSISRGGMLSKILAAQVAQKKGIETWLLKGDTAAGLVKVAQNQVVGTKIGIHKGSKKSGSKKS